eukprot:TRINITY_DN539_c0_g1_i3.p2 TRINITY_DN539_c0_g1~~TRINITY_DN539_c0_g1_i3.p2  ORF type:complete len:197 (+),score=29.15 TRINITY_DN539_c0_g1_i3:61-591(+)
MMSFTHPAAASSLVRWPSASDAPATNAVVELRSKSHQSLAYQQQKREEEARRKQQQQKDAPVPLRRYRLSAEIARDRQVVRGASRFPVALMQQCAGTKTEFCWPYGGENVTVCGSFSNWTQKIPLTKDDDGVWKTSLPLPVGTYQFKYVVDGTWCYDMKKPTCTDSAGNTNNFVRI